MKSKRYTEKFKEAIKQVTEQGYSVADLAQRLGTTTRSIYAWMKKYDKPTPKQSEKPMLSLRILDSRLIFGA